MAIEIYACNEMASKKAKESYEKALHYLKDSDIAKIVISGIQNETEVLSILIGDKLEALYRFPKEFFGCKRNSPTSSSKYYKDVKLRYTKNQLGLKEIWKQMLTSTTNVKNIKNMQNRSCGAITWDPECKVKIINKSEKEWKWSGKFIKIPKMVWKREDMTSSLILLHEMTHAFQYLDERDRYLALKFQSVKPNEIHKDMTGLDDPLLTLVENVVAKDMKKIDKKEGLRLKYNDLAKLSKEENELAQQGANHSTNLHAAFADKYFWGKKVPEKIVKGPVKYDTTII